MDWAEDFKLTLKKTVKKTRRQTTESSSSNSNKPGSARTISPDVDKLSFDKDFLDDDSSALDFKTTIPLSKKIGNWGEDVAKSGKGSKSKPNLIELERFSSTTATQNLSDDDIPVIPDMDDLADEAILNEMTEAPTVAVNRVATYKELTSDLLRHAAFASLEDIDLSILARCLQSEAVLHEPDEVWTWEKLFTEVTAEIHADKPRSADSSY